MGGEAQLRRTTRGRWRLDSTLRGAAVVGAFGAASLATSPAHAFIFSEHADVMSDAVRTMRADERTARVLDEIMAYGEFCSTTADCDAILADLPAIAADHSCTPIELRKFVRTAHQDKQHWLNQVRTAAWGAAGELRTAQADVVRRTLIRRRLNVALQLVDDDYTPRAIVDWAHFQLPRESGPLDLTEYLSFALAPGREANATASFANYHVAAIRLAAAARTQTGPARADLLTRALMTEVFAIHFVEDSFSAGHFVGHWGLESTRLGTHDEYSAEGVEAQRWVTLDARRRLSWPQCEDLVPTADHSQCHNKENDDKRLEALRLATEPPYRARGDAFMAAGDRAYAGRAVAKSLGHVLLAATDAGTAETLLAALDGSDGIEDYDSCLNKRVVPTLSALAKEGPIYEVVAEEPIPVAREPAPLRIRAEKGIFFGGSAGVEAGHASIASVDGLFPKGSETGNVKARATLRLGYGAGDLTDDALNGQAFADIGIIAINNDVFSQNAQSMVGFSLRVRAPGYLVFLDGLVAVALAETTRSPFFIKWAARAGTGGLSEIWASHKLFDSVLWQISALRDVTFNHLPNEPTRGAYRWELLAPVWTARYALPMAGDGWAQSTDVWVDVGASFTRSTNFPDGGFGAYAALSTSGRVFPPWLK
ncbi:MAG: hypothetical protein BGO98_18505 [Myxococcales bacterium 68-20]|nr:MAG: hypothetical protein BGO98_18505 [Myxococcales bacterium 68-20]